MNELYEELETPEGERNIFRITKVRYKSDQGFHPYATDKERTWFGFKGPG